MVRSAACHKQTRGERERERERERENEKTERAGSKAGTWRDVYSLSLIAHAFEK